MTEDDTHRVYGRSVAMVVADVDGGSSSSRPPQKFPQPLAKKIFATY
jgi:hypothetical protein